MLALLLVTGALSCLYFRAILSSRASAALRRPAPLTVPRPPGAAVARPALPAAFAG